MKLIIGMGHKFSILPLCGLLCGSLFSCSYGPFARSTASEVKPLVSSDRDGVPCLTEQQTSENDPWQDFQGDRNGASSEKYTPIDSTLMMTEQPQDSAEKSDMDTIPRAMVYDHSFSKNETLHVKISDYNPFKNNKFRVDLNAEPAHYPIDGKCISAYGMRGRRMHTGTDIKGTPKQEIRAVFAGVVRLSYYYAGYGNVIVIRHENGLETVYSHNQKNLVKVGQMVDQGQTIALCGRTGSASTEHLHFELRVQGKVLNPSLLFDFATRQAQPGQLVITSASGQIKAKRDNDGKTAQSTDAHDKTTTPPALGAHADSGASAAAVGASAGAKSTASPSKAATSGAKYHAVVKGDTLYGMALKYKTTVKNICALNGIKSTTVLALGRKIRIK